MTRIKNALFKAFHEDHAILGKGFHVLAMRIREGSVEAIKDAANKLDQSAGAHIAFEEFDFYPLLKKTSPSTDTDQMYKSHNIALSVIQDTGLLPAPIAFAK